MKYVRAALITVLIVLLCGISFAGDLNIKDVIFPNTEWGRQTSMITIQNNSENYKYITSKITVEFTDFDNAGKRVLTRPFLVMPTEDSIYTMHVPYFVPANFGKGSCTIQLYDVVDTLDELMESQIFYDTSVAFDNSIPEWVVGLIDTGLYVPIYVDQTIRFDNQFGKLLALFLYRGKSLEEISEICLTDLNFTNSYASHLVNKGFFKKTDQSYTPLFPIIEPEDFKTLKPIIDETIENIYIKLIDNLPAYDSAITSLVKAKALTSDPNDLMDGGSVLHHKFPTTLGLALWDRASRDFVNDGEPFTLFGESDQLDALMGQYMYMFMGPRDYRGNSFYYYLDDKRGERMYCGLFNEPLDRDPLLSNKYKLTIDRDFGSNRSPMVYSYQNSKLDIPVSVLLDGLNEISENLKESVDQRFESLKESGYHKGARYWAWNVVVNKVMNRMLDEGIIEKGSSDIFIFHNLEY